MPETVTSDQAQILVVEDETDIAALLAYHLARAGYGVRTVRDGEDALRVIGSDPPDVVVLDVMLPGASGYDVLQQIRTIPALAHVPVLLVTARREQEDRIRGLELGADDYVTKPFSPEELVLRVGAVLRRARSSAVGPAGRRLRSGAVVVDTAGLTVQVSGRRVDLTPKELRLLITLMERKGRVQTRQQLLESAWGISVQLDTRTVDMHVQRLRTKLGDAGDQIQTVRGFGYRLRPE